MYVQRIQSVLCAGAAVLALSTSAFAQNQWTIDLPVTMTSFFPTSNVTGSGDAPGAGLSATFAFLQEDANGNLIKQGEDDVTSVSHMVGGMLHTDWSQTLDPAQEQPDNNGEWPLSRVVDSVRQHDYRARIKATGIEISITDLMVEPL